MASISSRLVISWANMLRHLSRSWYVSRLRSFALTRSKNCSSFARLLRARCASSSARTAGQRHGVQRADGRL